MLTNLIDEIDRVVSGSYNLHKTKNIAKLHDLLNQIFVFLGKCSSKKDLNHITKLLISLLKKTTHEYFVVIDSDSKEMDEIQIEIGDSSQGIRINQNIEAILVIANRCMEIFLGIIRFSERLEAGLLSKEFIADKENIFFLNLSNNINKETALDICNACKSFFEKHRRLLFFNLEIRQKISNIKKEVIQDSLLYSFLLLASISSHTNHTFTMDIHQELIFYLINYIMNRNPEFDDYYLLEFSKKFECDNLTVSDENTHKKGYHTEQNIFLNGIFERAMHVLQIRSLNFNSFFVDQLIRLSKTNLTREIVLLKNSHRFIARISDFMISQIFAHYEMAKVFIETYQEENISATTSILHEMFSLDKVCAESILKELIIMKKTIQFRNMFFERCRKLDSAYIDCLTIFKNQIYCVPFEMVEKILNSHYLLYIVEELETYPQFIEKLSDFHTYKCSNDQKFDKRAFYGNLIEKLLVQRYKSKNLKLLLPENNYNPGQYTNSLVSLSSCCSSELRRNSLDITLEMMQKSIVFIEAFPSAIEYVLPFLKKLLSRFNRKMETKKSHTQDNAVEFIADESFSQSFHILDHGTASETFVMENTEVITKILNLTRPFILDWSLENLLRKLNPIFLMKNHVFPEKLQLDTLFFHSLQEIMYIIERNSKACCNSKILNEQLRNQEIVYIFTEELSKIFKSEDTFRTFIILKHCDLSKLLSLVDFMNILSNNLEKSQQHEPNNFYDEANPNITLPSFSQSTNDPTILGYKPLEKNDFITEDAEENNSISEHSAITQRDNHQDANRSPYPNDQHMQLSDLDETFSVISLAPNKEIKNRLVSYTNKHLAIDLMTEKMKFDLLKKGKSETHDNAILDFCRSRLLLNYSFKPGLAFYSSKITFDVKKTQFSLYINFYQYQFTGSQFLVKFYLNTGFFGIKILNRHIVLVFYDKNREKVVYQESLIENKINSAFEFNSRLLSCSLNDEKVTFNTGRVEKIEIGDGFKGILDKILFYENEKFNNKYRKPIAIEDFYIRFIQPLEKRCSFYNNFGFILFKYTPFFLSSRIRDIEIQNVFPIEQYDYERINNQTTYPL